MFFFFLFGLGVFFWFLFLFLDFPPASLTLSCVFFLLVARPCEVFPCVFIIADLVELLDR